MNLSFTIVKDITLHQHDYYPLLDILRFLSANTRFKSLLTKALALMENLGSGLDQIESVGLGNNWMLRYFGHGVEDPDQLRMTLVFSQDTNKNQEENWQIATRKK